ncbi:ferredoxin [Ornithinimicrobium sufpigmenti]|uniref:ferredoxin n=1 Tax=Ornithinimicrobium sufpigmenti TaxID=2508882 RepID=UPI001036C806|nr:MULTISPECIES: ferredoxin [unclassified Ornithinimicrobium]
MKVEIVKSKCQAYGNCADEAPELFVLDAGGYAEVVGDGTVPADQVNEARSAVKSCPARALLEIN